MYLGCYDSLRGLGCKRHTWLYEDFETAFLQFCRKLDVSKLLPGDDDRTTKISELRIRLEVIEGQVATNAKKLDALEAMIGMTDDHETGKHLTSTSNKRAALAEKKALKTQHKETVAALNKAQQSEEKAGRHLKSVNELIQLLANTEGKALVEMRTKLRADIRQLVERIEVFPDGLHDMVINLQESDMPYMPIAELEPDSGERFTPAEVENHIRENTGKDARCFGVRFKSGGFQEVRWHNGAYHTTAAGDNWYEVFMRLAGQE